MTIYYSLSYLENFKEVPLQNGKVKYSLAKR